MFTTRSLSAGKINKYFTCQICNGYLIDCLKIDECLHNFCKSCILNWLRKSTYCPVCGVEINRIKPWVNLRADISLQNMINKLIPNLPEEEHKRVCKFSKVPESIESSTDIRSEDQQQMNGQELICFALQPDLNTDSQTMDLRDNHPVSEKLPTIYVQSSSIIPIAVVAKYIRLKFGIPLDVKIAIMAITRSGHKIPVPESLVLADVAQTLCWTATDPLPLRFSVDIDFKQMADKILSANSYAVAPIKNHHPLIEHLELKTENTSLHNQSPPIAESPSFRLNGLPLQQCDNMSNKNVDTMLHKTIKYQTSNIKQNSHQSDDVPNTFTSPDVCSAAKLNYQFTFNKSFKVNENIFRCLTTNTSSSSYPKSIKLDKTSNLPFRDSATSMGYYSIDNGASPIDGHALSTNRIELSKKHKRTPIYYCVPAVTSTTTPVSTSKNSNASISAVKCDPSSFFQSAGLTLYHAPSPAVLSSSTSDSATVGSVAIQHAPAFVPIVINSNCIENHYHHQNLITSRRQHVNKPSSNNTQHYKKRKYVKSSLRKEQQQNQSSSKCSSFNSPVKKRYPEIRPRAAPLTTSKPSCHNMSSKSSSDQRRDLKILFASRHRVRRQRTLSDVLSHRIEFKENMLSHSAIAAAPIENPRTDPLPLRFSVHFQQIIDKTISSNSYAVVPTENHHSLIEHLELKTENTSLHNQTPPIAESPSFRLNGLPLQQCDNMINKTVDKALDKT
ncbi:hypothetical protein GJ496_009102 [Pomphorhynchus laevis]|nr:hypothetical protein GJ496_009102 [Pomphorhynchus laevis]